MIAVYFLCLLLALGLIFFVAYPLVIYQDSKMEAQVGGFGSEQEYREALGIRDLLVKSLVGIPVQDPLVDGKSQELKIDALTTVCWQLKKSGFSYLPDPKSLLTLLLIFGVWLLNPLGERALAQAAPSGDPHAGVTLPGLSQVGNHTFSNVHQFALYPKLGELGVQYLTVFSNPKPGSDLELSLPFPDGFSGVQFAQENILLLPKTPEAPWPRILIPRAAEQVELQADFWLPAPFGTHDWKFEEMNLPPIQGTMVFLLRQSEGTFRRFLESFMTAPNVYPPRIYQFSADFKSGISEDKLNPQDPNYRLQLKAPKEVTQYFLRQSPNPAPYPSFTVKGLVPSRWPLYLGAAAFGAILFAFVGFLAVRQRSVPIS
jgi:hypothetical protein